LRKLKMQARRLLNSTIFRLTLLYAAFFSISVIAILTFVYFATVREIESQIKHRINVQTNQAQAVFNAKGIEELKKQIAEFIEEEDEGLFVYILTGDNGKIIVGNMENWPQDIRYSEKWLMFDIESKNNDSEIAHVLARDLMLNENYRLLIGYSLQGSENTKQVMFDVILAGVIFAFAITVLGGAMFSGLIRRRLEAVNQICVQVIGGNLDVKVPLTGGGDEFENLAVNVNLMLERIVGLIDGLKQTSDNIAHDLRTPLNRHRIRLENIIKHPENYNHREIKSAIDEIDNIVETLNSILRISQAQSGIASGHLVDFDLSTIAGDVSEFYEEFAEQKNITVNLEIEENITMKGDKPMVTQAIANLLDNAIKYTSKGGEITICLSVKDNMVEFVVADNGVGIPENLYAKVKERFFRIEESRTSVGTGLGLSLVDAVAKLHHGELNFTSNNPGLRAILTMSLSLN